MDSYMASSYNDNRSCSNMEETTYQDVLCLFQQVCFQIIRNLFLM